MNHRFYHSGKLKGGLRMRQLILLMLISSSFLISAAILSGTFRDEGADEKSCELAYAVEWRESLTFRLTCGGLSEDEWTVSNDRCSYYSPLLMVEGNPGSSDQKVDLTISLQHSDNLDSGDTAYVNILVNGSVEYTAHLLAEKGSSELTFNKLINVPVKGNYQIEITLENDSDNKFWKIRNGDIRTCQLPVLESPVSVSDLKVVFESGRVSLNWNVNAVNTRGYFTVDASGDGVNFDEIGVVPFETGDSGSVLYSFVDDTPYNGINYYRLKITDASGYTLALNAVPVNAFFSEPISPSSLVLLPVAPDGGYALLAESVTGMQALLQVVDSSGNAFHEEVVHLNAGVNTLHLDMDMIPDGAHFSMLLRDQFGEVISSTHPPAIEPKITASLN